MARRSGRRAEGGASQKWMLTFSDMMTLLLTFFVLLFSMSSTDSENLHKALTSVQNAFSVFQLGTLGSGSPALGSDQAVSSIKPGEMRAAIDEMKRFISEEELEGDVQIRRSERGITLLVSDRIVFEPGSAKVRSSAYPLLHKAARLAARLAKTVRVEGNTDSTPTAGAHFDSNLELSGQRAINVLSVILQEKAFTPQGACVGALGQYNPVYLLEQTEKQRQANRRVEIHIVEPPDIESFWYALMRSYLDNKRESAEAPVES